MFDTTLLLSYLPARLGLLALFESRRGPAEPSRDEKVGVQCETVS